MASPPRLVDEARSAFRHLTCHAMTLCKDSSKATLIQQIAVSCVLASISPVTGVDTEQNQISLTNCGGWHHRPSRIAVLSPCCTASAPLKADERTQIAKQSHPEIEYRTSRQQFSKAPWYIITGAQSAPKGC